MYKYKTKGNVELMIPGIGMTVDGIITSDTPIENPNLELITSEQVVATPEPVAHMAGVVPQNAQSAQPINNQESEIN